LPTGLILSLDGPAAPLTVVLRVKPGSTNLERLGQLTAVAEGLLRGAVAPAEARARIDRIMSAPARWGRVATVGAYVFSAAAFAVFFGGGMTEVVASTWVGLVVGALAVALQSVRASSRLFELTAAASAALVATLSDWLLGAFV